MFEVGFTEIVLILGLALLVLGPEKLPGLAAKIGRWTGRARSMARQLRTQLEQEVTLDELAKSRPMQSSSPPPQDTAAASSTATADPSEAEHRTGPQEAQPYSESHSDPYYEPHHDPYHEPHHEPQPDVPQPDVNAPVADIEQPPASAGSPAAETATTKDGQ